MELSPPVGRAHEWADRPIVHGAGLVYVSRSRCAMAGVSGGSGGFLMGTGHGRRRGNRFARILHGAVAVTGLICVLGVGQASAQSQEFPTLPPIPASDMPAPPVQVAETPLSPDVMPVPPVQVGETPLSPVAPEPVVQPVATKVMGTTVRWLRTHRELSVRMSCGSSGRVAIFRQSLRIGRQTFICPASRATTVRVRITRTANRQLRVGANVRVRVISGTANRTSKLLRVVRRVRGTTSVYASCSGWYATNLVGGTPTWATNSSWYESVCNDSGFYGTHLANWWDYYYYTTARTWQYYGAWILNHADGCHRWWDVASLTHYGPYCPQ